jgi:hypothetical protein
MLSFLRLEYQTNSLSIVPVRDKDKHMDYSGWGLNAPPSLTPYLAYVFCFFLKCNSNEQEARTGKTHSQYW